MIDVDDCKVEIERLRTLLQASRVLGHVAFEEIEQLRAEVARLRVSCELRGESLRMRFEQIDQLRADVDQLRAVLIRARGFIQNGIALGYIRMPDADTPDTAHEMLPLIEAVLNNPGRRAC